MTKDKIRQNTGDYHKWLMRYLKSKESILAYLHIALLNYENNDDLESFLIALQHVLEANDLSKGLIKND